MGDEREQAAVADIMSGANVKQKDERLKVAIQHAIAEMKLRQWCVEQTVTIAQTSKCNIKEVAEFFYDFVTIKE